MVRTSWWGRDSSSSTDREIRQCRKGRKRRFTRTSPRHGGRAAFHPWRARVASRRGMERRSASGWVARTRALGALALAIVSACTRERPAPTPPPPVLPTIADRLAQYGDRARARMRPYFAVAEVAYPPSRVVLAGLKHERELLVYAAGADGIVRYVMRYPVL